MDQDHLPNELPETFSDLIKEIAKVNSRIVDLIAQQKPTKPWYREASTWISGSAFIVSLVTSLVSLHRAGIQDINSRKDALQALVQQFYTSANGGIALQYTFTKDIINSQKNMQNNVVTALNLNPPPTEMQLGQNDIANNAGMAMDALRNSIAAQSAMIAKKTASLAQELGSNASSIEMSETGFVMLAGNLFGPAENIFKLSVDRADSSMEYIAGTRGLGQAQYMQGKKDESKKTMEDSIKVFDMQKYKSEGNSEDFKNSDNAATYAFWLNFLGPSDCELSNNNLKEMDRLVGLLPPQVASGSGLQQKLGKFHTMLATCKE